MFIISCLSCVFDRQAASMARDARDRFTRDMSVDARDAKVEAYLRATTKGGNTMLDAAGETCVTFQKVSYHHILDLCSQLLRT